MNLLIKAMVFPVVMYSFESWTIKKVEHWRIDAFECGVGEDSWESLGLQGYQTSQSWNQPWISIGRTDAEAEVPILWPPDAKSWFIGKNLDTGKDWGQKEKGGREDDITDSVDMSLHKLQEIVKDRDSRCAAVCGVTKSWTWLSNWTTATSFPRSLRQPNKLLQALDWGIFLGAHPMLTCCHPPSADTPNCL